MKTKIKITIENTMRSSGAKGIALPLAMGVEKIYTYVRNTKLEKSTEFHLFILFVMFTFKINKQPNIKNK